MPIQVESQLLRSVRANAEAIALMRAVAADDLQRSHDIAAKTEASKLKFLAGISHELRTPLNSIIGFTDLILHGDVGQLENPRHIEYLTLIKGSAEHLNALVLSMLDAARVEMGKAALNLEVIDVGEVYRECAAILQSVAAGRRVVLEHGPAHQPDIQFRQDATRLRQILLNLLRNAIEHSPPGESVTFTIRYAEPVSGNSNTRVLFEVSDHGPGISEADQKYLFTPFHQIEDPFTKVRGGLGLGLSISWTLAGLMGGRLHCASRQGGGATFTLELPDKNHDPFHSN